MMATAGLAFAGYDVDSWLPATSDNETVSASTVERSVWLGERSLWTLERRDRFELTSVEVADPWSDTARPAAAIPASAPQAAEVAALAAEQSGAWATPPEEVVDPWAREHDGAWEPTLDLIDVALRALRDRPLLILSLARPDVREVFPGLWQGRELHEVRLIGLPRSASERLVRRSLVDPSDDVIARVVERAQGNAFLLEEHTCRDH